MSYCQHDPHCPGEGPEHDLATGTRPWLYAVPDPAPAISYDEVRAAVQMAVDAFFNPSPDAAE